MITNGPSPIRPNTRCARWGKVAALFLFVILAQTLPAFAARDWFFSDCATGGTGTSSDPFCLDVEGNGSRESFGLLFDGSGTEAACGDNIILCAGTCGDGAGSATYNMHPAPSGTSGELVNFDLDCAGTSPITVKVSCDNDSCDQVTITGDTNLNGVFDSGEGGWFFGHGGSETTNRRNYTIDGDPLNIGLKNLIFKRFGSGFFLLRTNPSDWHFNGLVIQEIGAEIWGPKHLADTPDNCTSSTTYRALFFANALNPGSWNRPVSITNSTIAHTCGFSIRNQGNSSLENGASFLVENVEFFNVANICSNFAMANETWRHIYAHDFRSGLQIKNQMVNAVVEDSTFACLGEWRVITNGGCPQAIVVDPGFESFDGALGDVTIRRNKIYGVQTPGHLGWLKSGIRFNSDNDTTSPTWIIENNMIWNIQSDQACNDNSFGSNPISATTNKPVIIRNNTLYKSSCGIYLDSDTATPVPVVHKLDNNIVARSTLGQEVFVATNASGSLIRNNNLWDFGVGDTVLAFGSGGTSKICTTIGSQGNGSNKCAGFKFIRCDDPTACQEVNADPRTWDLHLVSTDTVNKDAGTVGATDDIDGVDRPQGSGTDIGADEIGGVPSTKPPSGRVLYSPDPPKSSSTGTPLFREGSWQLTLQTDRDVITTPGTLILTDSQGIGWAIVLDGQVPGSSFSGTMTVTSTFAEGSGAMSLPPGALIDDTGLTGNQLTGGGAIIIDRTAPSQPTRPTVN